jgi:hypothetical protein
MKGSKKKKLESLVDMNKLNEKLDLLSTKMDYLEKYLMKFKLEKKSDDSNNEDL